MKAIKIALGASILNLAVLFWIVQKLPESIPVHLNINMAVDRYGSRWTIFIIGLIPVLFSAVRIKLVKVPAQNKKVYDILMPLVTVFLVIITWVPVLIAFQYGKTAGEPLQLPLDFIIAFPLGILIIILSNFMGIIKRNPWMGFRLYWTFMDETVWKKTHRLGGITGVISGSIICLSSVAGFLLENPKITFAGLLTAIIIIAVIPSVYSFCLYRKLHPNAKH